MFGWTGSILELDLTKESAKIVPTSHEAMTFFVGGKGLGIYYLWKNLPPGIDPLSPDNVIIVATGPLQGTRIMPNGRYCVVTKSPLTGLFLDAHAGGFVGPELKFSGFDAILIRGAASNPTWVSIVDDDIEFHDAKETGLWGLKSGETEKRICTQMNDSETRVISIGPAGENGVTIACLVSDGFHNAGRGGIGAVFGSKNLKAVSIRGHQSLEVADPEKENDLGKQFRDRCTAGRDAGLMIHSYGTSTFVKHASKVDQLPTRNFKAGEFDRVEKISGKAIEERWTIEKKPCYRCTLACAKIISDFTEHPVPVPEYETLAMLGSNCGIDNLETIISANDLCNQLGLDTISTGNVIGFFMECSSKGYLNESLLAESLSFGDSKGLLTRIQEIAERKDSGALLSDGVSEAAQKIGQNSTEFAIQVKNLEMPAWDPRGRAGMGISYAVSAVGASHLRGWPDPHRLPKEDLANDLMPSLILAQDEKIWKDILIICHFTHSIKPAFSMGDPAPIMAAVTGRELTEQQVRDTAQRIWILTRLFNMREWNESPINHDILPPRLMKEPLPSGSAEGCKAFMDEVDFHESLQTFYKLRKCDSEGRPQTNEINRLELSRFLSQ
ncbi:MAG: aldehyde ferredoxin oxidoreductase family protein [Promethearchaeota archaeon]